tara:strand:+ start:64 stop:564 length:501 start_codon:yes stop_codon:yes gene_type:complete
MKIEKNALSIMRDMLADPEKDWSNHLPFMKLTEEDFVKAVKLIKKHTKNADRREELLKDLELWIGNYKQNPLGRNGELEDFIWFLDRELGKRKKWETKEEIQKEIREVFNAETFIKLRKEIFAPYEEMFNHLEIKKLYQGHFQKQHKKLLETFDFEKASELLKEKN